MELEVPAGVCGGDNIEFVCNDKRVLAEVPPGLLPGDVFHVDVDEADSIGGATVDTATIEQLTVKIPSGIVEGDSIEVQAHDGSWFVVEVPTGFKSGMSLELALPGTLLAAPALSEAPTGAPASSPTALTATSALTTVSSSPPSPASPAGPATIVYPSDELREPAAEPGEAFFVGQHVTMRRTNGRLSNGVVLGVLDAYETLYRCRIGDHAGTLEKNCTEGEIQRATPPPGFAYTPGDMVRVARQCDGRVVLATVLEPTFVEDDPSYRLRLEAADEEDEHGACVETHSEEDVALQTTAAPNSGFAVGQLVQVRQQRADGTPAFSQLARVVDFVLSGNTTHEQGVRLVYRCRHVQDGWGFPAGCD